jgi:tRNA nucleotidyltransferase (CCA-adding enzyme)
VGEHILHSLLGVEPKKVLRLAMLFHDIGKPQTLTWDEDKTTHFHGHASVSAQMAKQILRRLKFDNDTIYMVSKLAAYHDYGNGQEPDARSVRRAINKIGEDAFPALFQIKRADIYAQSDYQREEKLKNLDDWQRLYEEIREKKQCVSLKELAVSGSDLIEIGIKPGRQLGEILEKLLEAVIEEPERNTKERLLELIPVLNEKTPS